MVVNHPIDPRELFFSQDLKTVGELIVTVGFRIP